MHTQGMLKKGSLANKTYIVTGGGSGLGYSMSKYLLELEGNVIIVSRNNSDIFSHPVHFYAVFYEDLNYHSFSYRSITSPVF